MNEKNAIAQAYEIISELITSYLEAGNPDPGVLHMYYEDTNAVADKLQELRDHCVQYSENLKRVK